MNKGNIKNQVGQQFYSFELVYYTILIILVRTFLTGNLPWNI